MDLLQNPFFILRLTPRADRRKIIERAEERSLMIDSNVFSQAESDLTNPRKRLSAEIAWLPGLGPKRVKEVLALLGNSVNDLLSATNLTSMARTNLLAAGLSRLTTTNNPEEIAKWILELAWAFEGIKPEEVCAIINKERIVPGFPEVKDLSMVEAEIQERRRHYRQVIKSALDNLSAKDLVEAVTVAVESATNNGKEHGPILVDDLVDAYEVEAQAFLKKEARNIEVVVEKLRAAADAERPDSTLAPMVSQLIKVVKNWDTVAQPIQISTKSRGLDHEASHEVAGLVRGVAIQLYNEHEKLDFSQQLINMLQEVFAEVVEFADRTAEDASALDDIAEQRAQLIEDAKNRTEEWRESISINIDLGTLFRNRFKISPNGIEWKNRLTPLDEVNRIRWGGSTYSIMYGTHKNLFHLKVEHEGLFDKIVQCLWRAVGVRILTEFLEGLRDGVDYLFGNTVINDLGMELERKNLFFRNDHIFCCWSELHIWNEAGVFCIGKKDDKGLAATFSYQHGDNIHILESAIRMLWKQGGDRLSSLLEE